jgi:acetyl-CoA acetyltransferase
MDVAIVGWGHTCFGLPQQDTPQSLIAWAAREALADAIVPPHALDRIRLTIFNAALLAKWVEPNAMFNMGGSGAVSYCSRPETRKVA